jgi:putative membrane protein
MDAMFLRLLVGWAINALALWVADLVFSGVHISGIWSYVIGAGVLGIANAILKPIVTLLTLPLVIITLGLFMLVINVAMLALAEWAAPHLSIDGFWTYVGAVVIIWLVNWVAHLALDRAEGDRRGALG